MSIDTQIDPLGDVPICRPKICIFKKLTEKLLLNLSYTSCWRRVENLYLYKKIMGMFMLDKATVDLRTGTTKVSEDMTDKGMNAGLIGKRKIWK